MISDWAISERMNVGLVQAVPERVGFFAGYFAFERFHQMMWYRLLGQVGVKFVYEGGVGALPLSENGNKARRRKEAIAN